MSNGWHLVATADASGTRDSITAFVANYNAYRTMETANAERRRDHPIDRGTPIISYANRVRLGNVVSRDTIAARSAADDPTTYVSTGNGVPTIDYHGGPVLSGAALNVYLIWYGHHWSQHPRTQRLIRQFIGDESDSAYWHINLTYPDGHGNLPSRVLRVAGELSVGIPHNRSLYTLSEDEIRQNVWRQISARVLPYDEHGVYLLLAAENVLSVGLFTDYCGWHNYMTTPAGLPVVYGFIGNPATNSGPTNYGLFGCMTPHSAPNGDWVGDAMINLIAHEVSESATDPLLNAWFDNADGSEADDRCAWDVGDFSILDNGHRYNVTLNGRNYIVQQNWVSRGGGYCGLRVE